MRVVVDGLGCTQEVILEADERRLGARWLAVCGCGHRTLRLHLDPDGGTWRCWKCMRLRSARDRFRGNRFFNMVERPLLDLAHEARRTLRPGSHQKRVAKFAERSARVLAEVAKAAEQFRDGGSPLVPPRRSAATGEGHRGVGGSSGRD
jgi:hypothetical protein